MVNNLTLGSSALKPNSSPAHEREKVDGLPPPRVRLLFLKRFRKLVVCSPYDGTASQTVQLILPASLVLMRRNLRFERPTGGGFRCRWILASYINCNLNIIIQFGPFSSNCACVHIVQHLKLAVWILFILFSPILSVVSVQVALGNPIRESQNKCYIICKHWQSFSLSRLSIVLYVN